MKIRKLFAAFLTASLFVSSICAELASPHRYFEVGFDAEAGVSNNYFKAKDVMVEDLVIDLKKIAQEMPSNGFILDYELFAQGHISLDVNKYFRFNIFYGLDGSGFGNISKNLFEMIGNGIEANTNEKIDLELYADLYYSAGFSVKTDIKGVGVRLTPAFFVPVLHVANTEGYLSYTSKDTGLIRAEADIPVDVYSIISLENIKDTKVDVAFVEDLISKSVKSGGFDFSGEVEKHLTKTFDLGFYTRIPILAGKLKHKASTHYWGIFEESNLLGKLEDNSTSRKDYGHDEITYSEASCKVHRPFLLGFEGAWRPFGDWSIFRPKVGFVVRNPYASYRQCFWEWGVTADFIILKVVGLRFGTEYENLVFKQTMGFMVNTRLAEINAAVQFRGADFANSFGISGASGIVSMKFGF